MGLRGFVQTCRRKWRSFRTSDERANELARWRTIAKKVREFAAYRYIRGNGIEIGALNSPLRIYHGAEVRYVDRLPTEKLRLAYPTIPDQDIVQVEIVEDAEKLTSVADESCDFVIANHVLEHTRNPIAAIANMFRVLRPDGILYLAVPDKRFTFDEARAVTSYDHLKRDYFESPDGSDAGHYLDWIKSVGKVTDESEAEQKAKQIQATQGDIHFHVWTQRDFIELLLCLRHDFRLLFEIEAMLKNSQEFVVVLRKADLG